MKKLSIRAKITLWFSIALIIVVIITYFMVLSVSNQIIHKTIRDNLIETVEDNVDEIEYFATIDDIDLENDVDQFIRYEDGFLEIDDDFLNEVNQIYTSLYYSDGTLLYGENPVIIETSSIEFIDSQIQKVNVDGTIYYIFDRQLTQEGLEGLWLRGVVSETQGNIQIASIYKTSLILMPLLVFITILGGYIIARRALRPIQQISDSATKISQGGDLKQRIQVGDGNDELHKLANNFNDMFERLDKSFQIEKQFTSDASHELRTPVSVIMAQCELSLEKDRSVDEYKEALSVIDRQSKKMSKLINDMLDFTRLELKSNQYIVENIDLTELFKSICSDMSMINANNITLEYNLEDSIFFSGNNELLTCMLTNLINNSYRYGKKDGHIWVKLESNKDNIFLYVKDDGIGIAKEEQAKIFNRFYQAENSRSNEGTGLGLSMVKEIVDFHKGKISVESELDIGSTFTITFPK